MLLWTSMCKLLCGCIFSVFFSIYLRMELLGHTVTPCLTSWGTARLFFETPTSIYIVISSVCEFQFLHILANTCYCYFLIFFQFLNYFIVVQLQLSAFSPHPLPNPSQTPLPPLLPPSPLVLSMCPLYVIVIFYGSHCGWCGAISLLFMVSLLAF